MSNCQDGKAVLCIDFLNGILYFFLTLWIKGTCGFIKNQNLRVFEKCSGYRKPLLLPSREVDNRTRPNESIQLLFKAKNEFSISLDKCLLYLLIGSIPISKKHVLSNCSNDKSWLLGNIAYRFSELLERN